MTVVIPPSFRLLATLDFGTSGSGTYTALANAKLYVIHLWSGGGGGGGGGSSSTGQGGGGGGGGGYAQFVADAASLGSSISYFVSNGGGFGTAGNNGSSGNPSYFGPYGVNGGECGIAGNTAAPTGSQIGGMGGSSPAAIGMNTIILHQDTAASTPQTLRPAALRSTGHGGSSSAVWGPVAGHKNYFGGGGGGGGGNATAGTAGTGGSCVTVPNSVLTSNAAGIIATGGGGAIGTNGSNGGGGGGGNGTSGTGGTGGWGSNASGAGSNPSNWYGAGGGGGGGGGTTAGGAGGQGGNGYIKVYVYG